MRIYNNISALRASNLLGKVNKSKTSNLEKLSSGLRINKASDDAAGLAISEKMRAQIRGMKQAARNASDGQAMLQTTEGSLEEINSILHRMRELTVQVTSETYAQDERDKVMVELRELNAEVLRIATATKFNGKTLIAGKDGTAQSDPLEVTLQVGANNDANEKLTLKLPNILSINETIGNGLDTIDGAKGDDQQVTTALSDFLDIATGELESVSKARSVIGSNINRLDCTINNLNSSIENLVDAESRIRDLDIAEEMSNFTRNNILSQSGAAMLSAANKMPEGILQLLQ